MRRETIISAVVFAAIPLVMLTLALTCTWAIAHGASVNWRVAFRIACHGIPSHCLIVWGVPMPICARCTAIYVGLFAGVMLFFAVPFVQERLLRAVMLAGLVPMGIDGVTQLVRIRESTNGLRLATGLLAGLTFGMWVLSAIERRDDARFTTP